MKKVIGLFVVIMVMAMSTLVFAGDIPEGLLHSDDAQIFFGEVISYNTEGEISYAEVLPTEKIKGDVIVGSVGTYQNISIMGDFEIKEGKIYLFTFYDNNNPFEIFEFTGNGTGDLKLKNVQGDMWKRFEQYLNEGRYLEAEHERLDRLNKKAVVKSHETVLLVDVLGVNRDKARSVSISYDEKTFDVDVDEFYEAIEEIELNKIEPTPMLDDNNTLNLSGIYITVDAEEPGFLYISDSFLVDRNSMMFSRLPVGQYSIDSADYAKIKYFTLSDEEKISFSFLETSLAGKVFYLSIGVVLIFVILFVIGYNTKKKRSEKR